MSRDGAPITAELKGYSKHDKKFHHVWAMGEGTWGSLVSPGWTGNRMLFEEDHHIAVVVSSPRGSA